ncbi:hypothetical protein ACOSP7_019026 [Xanthoceras sorbifolium]
MELQRKPLQRTAAAPFVSDFLPSQTNPTNPAREQTCFFKIQTSSFEFFFFPSFFFSMQDFDRDEFLDLIGERERVSRKEKKNRRDRSERDQRASGNQKKQYRLEESSFY